MGYAIPFSNSAGEEGVRPHTQRLVPFTPLFTVRTWKGIGYPPNAVRH
jgi:hypothetical protein